MKKVWILGVLFVAVFICKGDPLDHWAWRAPLPPGDNVVAITSGNGQFVAVGEHGNIITSSDGTNWISRQIGNDVEFKSIAFGNGLFVAVGFDIIEANADGAIYFSTNAADWKSAIDPTTISGLYGAAFGDDAFVAVGIGGEILRSTDGIHWVGSNDSSDCCSDLVGVCYGNGQFVVAQCGGAILVSSNGSNNWIEYDPGIFDGFWNMVSGNGLYVASGYYGIISSSTNGIDWSNSGTSYPIWCVGFGNGQFIANDGEVSTDGVNWTPGNATVDGSITGAVWDNNIYVAVGSGASSVFTSMDGTEWNPVNSGNFNSMSRVIYAQNEFVAVGSGILTSSNGVNWMPQNSGTPARLFAITYGNGLFVAVGSSVWSGNGYSSPILTSPDSINWTQATNLPATFPYSNGFGLSGIAHRCGLFVAVGDGGTILTSSDGTNWAQQVSGVGNSLYGIACGKDGRFVTVGESGGWDGEEYPDTILTSTDGTNWTAIFHASGEWFLDVTYGDGQYVAVGDSDILTSPDGMNWTNHSGVGQWLQTVTYGNGYFVAVGTSGGGGAVAPIVSSTDGTHWISHYSGTGNALLGVTYGNGTFEAVGNVILQSQPIIRLFPPIWLSNGSLKIKIEGEAGITNTIQVSGDLFNWIDLTNVVFTNPSGSFVDPSATNCTQRFYRSIVFP